MTKRAHQMLGRRFGVITEPGQGTLLSFVAPRDPEECVARAAERGVIVRGVPGRPWLRASLGYWNNEADVERLIAALN